MRREATEAAAGLEQALRAEPSREHIRNWLMRLGILCAGQMAADDARVKIAGYTADLLHLPAALFTDDTRRSIAAGMKWFPSYGELLSGLALEENRLKLQLLRLRRVAETPDPVPPAPRQPVLQIVPPAPAWAIPASPARDPDQIASEAMSREEREAFWTAKLGA